MSKVLSLLHELVPKAVLVGVLVNPTAAPGSEATLRDVREAAPALGLQIQVVNASTIGEINAAFAALAHERAEALFVTAPAFFTSRRVQLATLATRDRIPAAYVGREFPVAGGLMSYGTNLTDGWRQLGVYTGNILKGDAEIETAITALGREPGGGLVVMVDVFTSAHRAPLISAAARNNVPAVYWASEFVKDGGLLSYGVDRVDTFRRAASYVDRILRGAKPAELPVQLPTQFEMVLNLKTAKALGLTVPRSIRLRADEVIE
jgi:ABC-type uncharacterized transport system substrate-binding protein